MSSLVLGPVYWVFYLETRIESIPLKVLFHIKAELWIVPRKKSCVVDESPSIHLEFCAPDLFLSYEFGSSVSGN
jgi:hypothetical protein